MKTGYKLFFAEAIFDIVLLIADCICRAKSEFKALFACKILPIFNNKMYSMSSVITSDLP